MTPPLSPDDALTRRSPSGLGSTRSKFASRMAQLSLLPAVLAKLVWVWRCGFRSGGDGHAGAIQADADAPGTPAGVCGARRPDRGSEIRTRVGTGGAR